MHRQLTGMSREHDPSSHLGGMDRYHRAIHIDTNRISTVRPRAQVEYASIAPRIALPLSREHCRMACRRWAQRATRNIGQHWEPIVRKPPSQCRGFERFLFRDLFSTEICNKIQILWYRLDATAPAASAQNGFFGPFF
jgi:hypothetical protein